MARTFRTGAGRQTMIAKGGWTKPLSANGGLGPIASMKSVRMLFSGHVFRMTAGF